MDAYRASHVSFVGFPYFSRRNRKNEEMPRLKHKGIRHHIVQVHTIFSENALFPLNILCILKKAKIHSKYVYLVNATRHVKVTVLVGENPKNALLSVSTSATGL